MIAIEIDRFDCFADFDFDVAIVIAADFVMNNCYQLVPFHNKGMSVQKGKGKE